MGKKRSAARRAATAAPAPALAPTASPAVSFDTHAALVDTPSAPAVREPPTNTQQPRVSHEVDAIRAPRAASPAHLPIETTLAHEPASADAPAAIPVAIATPQLRAARALDSCPEQSDSPPALTTHTSTSSDVSANAPQQSRVSNHTDKLVPPQDSIPALSAPAAAAAAELATVIDTLGPPTVFLACPTHSFSRAEDFGHELDALAPRMCPATSIEEIDEDLLEHIIEDAQNTMRIEARREIRVKALEEGRKRGWNDGFEEGMTLARRAARPEVHQWERGWKDGYEQGRWEGYHEGLEVARTEVSTPSSVDASVQADVSTPPHSPPADTVPAPARVDAGVQFDATLVPFPSRADLPPPILIDTVPTTPHVNADVQSDDSAPCTPSTPTSACATTPRINDATSHVNAAAQTDGLIPTRTAHTDTGVQAEDVPPPVAPLSPADDSHSPQPRIQASAQTDTPCTSAPVRARTVHEIDHDLLREILAAAIAKGEAAGLKKGKHVGFQDGMEAGWKSGTREGHEDGFREGKQSGITEGREQYRLEASRISRAVAVVQTDYGPPPTRVNSSSQTAMVHVLRPTTSSIPTDTHPCTIISLPVGTNNMPSDSFMTSSNNVSMSNNDSQHFSWADEASSLPIASTALLISPPPRDFSILRSSSARPFDSLKRRARRSQAWPTRLSRPSRPFIPSSEPVITRRHPAGLRADRPAVVVLPSSTISHSVKLDTPPLDWQGDPRLQELGRVLRGLGWVHSSGS